MTPEQLPDTAQPVWQAYLAMADSKQKHFQYLQMLDDKYRDGTRGSADAAEETALASLLAAHDERVGAFRGLMAQLRIDDPPAFAALVRCLSDDADTSVA